MEPSFLFRDESFFEEGQRQAYQLRLMIFMGM